MENIETVKEQVNSIVIYLMLTLSIDAVWKTNKQLKRKMLLFIFLRTNNHKANKTRIFV